MSKNQNSTTGIGALKAAVVLTGLFWLFAYISSGGNLKDFNKNYPLEKPQKPIANGTEGNLNLSPEEIKLLSTAPNNIFLDPYSRLNIKKLKRADLNIGYEPAKNQAAWVSYQLLAESLGKSHDRNDFAFKPDPEYGKITPNDYTHTGYDRGHLAPAADMDYSKNALESSFYMSNIAPQTPGLNRGKWRALETWCREQFNPEEKIFIITGPIYSQKINSPKNKKLIIPSHFYKIIISIGPSPKVAAFVLENADPENDLWYYLKTIDEIENTTGLDFFEQLPDSLEKKIEGKTYKKAWQAEENSVLEKIKEYLKIPI